MKNLKRLPLFLLLSICCAFAACSSDDDNDNDGDGQKNTAQQQQEKIVAQLNSNGETSAFASAFSQLDLSNSTASGFAIFAVTDEALQSDAKAAASISQALLKRHVAEGVFDLTSIAKLKYVKALSGDTLRFATSDGKLTVNGVELGTPKIVGNNIIFTINSLIPVANPVEPTVKCLFELTTYGDDGIDKKLQFKYTSSGNQLTSYTETFSNGEYNDHTFTYDNNGNLTKYERYSSEGDSIDFSNEYTYIGDTVFVSVPVSYREGHQTDVLVLDRQTGRLKELYTNLSNHPHVYEYDSNKNLSKRTEDLDFVDRYSYDNKKSILSNIGMPAWFWTYNNYENFDLYAGENNILKKEYSYSSDIDTYTYEYDEDGYPTKIYEGDDLTATVSYVTATDGKG